MNTENVKDAQQESQKRGEMVAFLSLSLAEVHLSKTPAQVKREAEEAKAEKGTTTDDEGGDTDGENCVRNPKRNRKSTVASRRGQVDRRELPSRASKRNLSYAAYVPEANGPLILQLTCICHLHL